MLYLCNLKIPEISLNKFAVDIQTYKRFFSLLLSGKDIFFDKKEGYFFTEHSPSNSPISYPKIGIYIGNGSSHSWLWLVDLFEKYRLYDIAFIEGEEILEDKLNTIDIFIVSGGDTFAIGEEIGEVGSYKVKNFLEKGGSYIGICAGAYLMLSSSKIPLKFFNFSGGKIKNLTSTPPRPINMSYKFSIPYGCQYVYHPVRGAVQIQSLRIPPFYRSDLIISPIFGGGLITPSKDLTPLANFHSFTEDTVFLVNPEIASDIFFGSCAAVMKNYGDGMIFLYSPHFEHPTFPEGNNIIIDTICYGIANTRRKDPVNKITLPSKLYQKIILKKIKSFLSNARIIVYGLVNNQIYWKIGNKVWEAEKISVFIESIWKRINIIERSVSDFRIEPSELSQIATLSSIVLNNLKKLKSEINKGSNSEEESKTLFKSLTELSSLFFKNYFKSKLDSTLKNVNTL